MIRLLEQYGQAPLMAGPVAVGMSFYFERPKSHMGTGRNVGTVKKSAPKHHIVKPDIDNLYKFALDCMVGIVLKDDSQVIIIRRTIKWYAKQNETIIMVEEL